jgi:hypothetical protein
MGDAGYAWFVQIAIVRAWPKESYVAMGTVVSNIFARNVPPQTPKKSQQQSTIEKISR